MAEMGIAGVRRQKKIRTTRPAKGPESRALDLVRRHFFASAPNRLWVADLTYCSTWAGFAYVAFIIDVYSRAIVGWKLSTTLRTELALDALEMAIFSRRGVDLSGLVHHSDRGVQYRDVRYTERLDAEEAVASVGSRGDSYDKALVSYCTSLRWSGRSPLVEPAPHALAQGRVAGVGWLEEPHVLVVGLVRHQQSGAVPGLDRGHAHAEALGHLRHGQHPPGAESFAVAGQTVAAA